MEHPIFVYGTLRDPDVRAIALGPRAAQVSETPATLPGYSVLTSPDGPFPVIRRDAGAAAPGALLGPGDRDVVARLDRFEVPFGYALTPVTAQTGAGPVPARVYLPPAVAEAAAGPPWTLEGWRANGKALFLELAREHVEVGLGDPPHPAAALGLLRRSLARLAARAAAPRALGWDPGPDSTEPLRRTRVYSGFHVMERHSYRFRSFAGDMRTVRDRDVMVNGDVVSVLPWDPVRDTVLLIEQMRVGPFVRGEGRPWLLEVVAGLIDKDEAPEDVARREAQEEAGLTLGRLHRIGGYYVAPGAQTEYATSYIGEADLQGYAPGTFGLDSEGEDIRTLVLSRAAAVALIDSGEARAGPLLISLLALDRQHEMLRAAWA